MASIDAGQVLIQVQEFLRNSALSSTESELLAFQLLVWAHLSVGDRLEPESTIDAAASRGAAGVVEALSRIALIDDRMRQAFGDAPRRAQFAGDFVVPAAHAAKRLAEGGIFDRFSPADMAAAVHQGTGEFMTVPPEVARLMVQLAVGPNARSVYCPWESSGQFVGPLLSHGSRVYVETPFATPLPALLSLVREAETDIVLGNPLRSPTALSAGHLEKFDAAVSIPPMNMLIDDDVVANDLYGRFIIKRATGNGLNVQHILAQTDGKAAIIVANSFLFGPGKDRELREQILIRGWVEAVIALPAGLLSATSIPSALLVLNTRSKSASVKFLDASRSFFQKSLGKGRSTLINTDAIADFCTQDQASTFALGERAGEAVTEVVSIDEILANQGSLQVDRYVVGRDQREMQARLEAFETTELDVVVEVLSPLPNKDRGVDSPSAIEVHEVGAVDLPAAGYIRTPERTIKIELSSRRSGRVDDVFLRAGDLVLIVKGSTGKIGIVPGNVPTPGAGGWIAGQSAVVLRSRGHGVDLRGLGLWLRSRFGQKLLDSIKSGATIPMISIATLRKLKVIALIPQWTEIAIAVLEEEDDLQHQIDLLRERQADIAEDLWAKLLAPESK